MVKTYKYSSPFITLISFHKLVNGIEQIALSDIDYRSNYAIGLLDQIKDKPEFISGIDNIEFITDNIELIRYLLADLFPTALTLNEIKAVTLPFVDFTFNYSERFKKILNDVVEPFDINIRDMDEHQFYISNCLLILNSYYKQNIDFSKPLFYDIPDKNGILKHYKITYNADFIDIYPTENTKFLNQTDIDKLIDNYNNLELWKEAFPANSWVLKGFVIVSLFDVSIESAISNLKSSLLKSDLEKSKTTESFESIFRSVFKIPDLKIGFTVYSEEEDLFIKPSFDENKMDSFLLLDDKDADCKNALCGASYESLIENKKSFIISDIEAFSKIKDNKKFGEHLLNQNFRSFILAPVIKDNKLLGLIELASSRIRCLNSINANKLELIIPYLIDTIERNNSDMINQMEAVIQREYTSIHPSVYWKFKKEARNFIYSNTSTKDYVFKEISFKEVFPLCGQIDIKGSSSHRNETIKTDLKHQLVSLIEIIESINSLSSDISIKQIKLRLNGFINDLNSPLKADTEQRIQRLIENEINPILRNAKKNSDTEEKLNNYANFSKDKNGMFYHARKAFDQTLSLINKKMAVILDKKQVEAQGIFPHYYERFKTDGVEHNIYIGSSINPKFSFNESYLKDLRLWQLEAMCEMELEHHHFKTTLPYILDVTSLILVFSSPISIRFRMDEKRFDIDGSYNARYEVLKKRIDKAKIKGSEKRITEKDKITIVYSLSQDKINYLSFITLLQNRNILESTIEEFEVEDLQGVSGLKALRVKVNNCYKKSD